MRLTINVQGNNQRDSVSSLRLTENLTAQGHPNLLGTHKMTFEITKAVNLSRRGDCVIGVRASKSPADFSAKFREACTREGAKIMVTLEAAGVQDVVHGSGSPSLTLTHPSEMVGRRSYFASDRTVMVGADKAACSINRRLIEALKSSTTKLSIEISVEA